MNPVMLEIHKGMRRKKDEISHDFNIACNSIRGIALRSDSQIIKKGMFDLSKGKVDMMTDS